MSVSIRRRLLITGSLVLAAFIGLTGVALDQAYRTSALEALKDREQVRIYSLISAAETPDFPSVDQLIEMPAELPETRFSEQGSGLYGVIVRPPDHRVWRSSSSAGLELPVPKSLTTGQWSDGFEQIRGLTLFRTSYQVEWEAEDGQYYPLVFSVYEEPDAYFAQIASFRRTLWIWLGATGLTLLLAQLLMLAWSLKPLRKIARDLARIERGQAEKLNGEYPRELSGLAANINTLLKTEKRRLQRYRNALGDLSHSLKTPLAILRGETGRDGSMPSRELLVEQTEHMQQTIDYHLQKASAAGRSALSKPLPIQPLAEKTLAALAKVYADRKLAVDVNIEPQAAYPMEQGDLMELLGNLLDNAFKWARSRVKLTVSSVDSGLQLVVEDDGPGIDAKLKDRILKRGIRADSVVDGHGLGLAMVRELVSLYGGHVRIEDSTPQGARFNVFLPDPDISSSENSKP